MTVDWDKLLDEDQLAYVAAVRAVVEQEDIENAGRVLTVNGNAECAHGLHGTGGPHDSVTWQGIKCCIYCEGLIDV